MTAVVTSPRAIANLPGTFTATSLQIQGHLPFEQWVRVGEALRQLRDSSLRWWLGDWLNYGERGYGEEYTQAVDQFDYMRGSLHNMAWVCRVIEPSRRREGVSFAHHQEVAGLAPDEQDRLLAEAEKQGWNRETIRLAVRQERDPFAEASTGKELLPPYLVQDDRAVSLPDVLDWIEQHPQAAHTIGVKLEQVREDAEPRSAHIMRVMGSSESPEWYTPSVIVARVIDFFGGIDLDPCSNSHEHPNVPAVTRYTHADDGLARSWGGHHSVYMNPPYGTEIPRWTNKMVSEYEAEAIAEAIALLPARIDTQWYQPLYAYLMCHIEGRLVFENAEYSAPFPSVIVYLGKRREEFIAAFRDLGPIMQRIA